MAKLTVKADGTADYTTFAAANSAAQDGDIIEIQDSSVYEEQNINTFDDNIQFIATGSNRPMLKNQSSYQTFYMYNSGTYFQNIHFNGPRYNVFRQYRNEAASMSISGCYFEGSTHKPGSRGFGKITSGFYKKYDPSAAVGTWEGANPHCLIDRCVFIHTGSANYNNARYIGVHQGYLIIRNSLIVNNAESYPGVYNYYFPANVTASFCTFVALNEDVDDTILYRMDEVNNCVVSATGDHTLVAIQAQKSRHNTVCVYPKKGLTNGVLDLWQTYDGSDWVSSTGSIGDIQGPVHFKDPGNFDYRLDTPSCDNVSSNNLKAYYKFTPTQWTGTSADPAALTGPNDVSGNLWDWSGNGYHGYLSHWFGTEPQYRISTKNTGSVDAHPFATEGIGPADCMSISWGTSYTPSRPSGSLVLYFKMENSGSNTLTDYSNYGLSLIHI